MGGARVPYPIQWGKAVTTSELGRRERLVCYALQLHMNANGICRPTIATIATRSAYGTTSVKSALDTLERLGWIVRHGGRTGRASTYQGVIPDGGGGHPGVTTGWTPQSVHQESREEKKQADGEEFGGF